MLLTAFGAAGGLQAHYALDFGELSRAAWQLLLGPMGTLLALPNLDSTHRRALVGQDQSMPLCLKLTGVRDGMVRQIHLGLMIRRQTAHSGFDLSSHR